MIWNDHIARSIKAAWPLQLVLPAPNSQGTEAGSGAHGELWEPDAAGAPAARREGGSR
jgi:hypothetical protein